MHNTQKIIGAVCGVVLFVLFAVGLAYFPEPAAVAETPPAASGSEPAPTPMIYTYQQIYDTQAYGPNRPECTFFRQHVLASEPYDGSTWAARPETSHTLSEQEYWIRQYGCTTIEERLNELEQAQKWEGMNDMYEYQPPEYPDMELPSYERQPYEYPDMELPSYERQPYEYPDMELP
jgi:hypothetical protein